VSIQLKAQPNDGHGFNACDWVRATVGDCGGCRRIKAKSFTMTAMRLCWDLTACHVSRNYPAVRPLEPIMKKLIATFIASAGFAFVAFAQAMPIAPLDQPEVGAVIQVFGG
jgi:hypothetical protein